MKMAWAAALALTLCLGSGVACPAEADDGVVTRTYTGMTKELFKGIMGKLGLEYTITEDGDGDPVFVFSLATYKVAALFYNKEGEAFETFQLHAVWSSDFDVRAKVNEWNKTRRFSRAYVDDDGDPHLESDIDLEHGVSEKTILAFIQRFRVSIESFASMLTD